MLAAFRDSLTTHFNLGELRGLCFDLGIDYESLAGETRPEKAIGLIEYCHRHGLLAELLARCEELRPQVAWPELSELEFNTPQDKTPDDKGGGAKTPEQTVAGDSFNVRIGDVSAGAQVAVGKDISQTQGADLDQIADLIGELREAIKAESSPEELSAAEGKLADLEAEISAEEPELAKLQGLNEYFEEKGGKIAGAAKSLFQNEHVQTVLKTAAEIAVAATLRNLSDG